MLYPEYKVSAKGHTIFHVTKACNLIKIASFGGLKPLSAEVSCKVKWEEAIYGEACIYASTRPYHCYGDVVIELSLDRDVYLSTQDSGSILDSIKKGKVNPFVTDWNHPGFERSEVGVGYAEPEVIIPGTISLNEIVSITYIGWQAPYGTPAPAPQLDASLFPNIELRGFDLINSNPTQTNKEVVLNNFADFLVEVAADEIAAIWGCTLKANPVEAEVEADVNNAFSNPNPVVDQIVDQIELVEEVQITNKETLIKVYTFKTSTNQILVIQRKGGRLFVSLAESVFLAKRAINYHHLDKKKLETFSNAKLYNLVVEFFQENGLKNPKVIGLKA